jgi:uncharacterized repeat protein (TIGR01451 family)
MFIRRPRKQVLSAGLAIAAACAGVMVVGAQPVAGAPGTPGTPQAPVTVFTEDFENGQGATPIQLPSYVGAAPLNETYSADPSWLINCNGWIASQLNPLTEPPGSQCGGTFEENRRLAGSLGQFAGTGAATNHALGWETAGVSPGANKVALQTNTPIPVPSNRFLTIGLDAADGSCTGFHARFVLSLLDGSTAIPTFSVPVEPCANPQAIFGEDHVGTYVGDLAVPFAGTSLGIRLVNAEGNAFGNDAAIDRLRILDVTPQLDKSFGAATVPEHGNTTLTFTVTNTTELAAKNGWSFTDTLPAGLVANPASVSTNCPSGTVSATPGTVSVSGNLAAGQASCTASVQVSATGPGAYTNCAANITSAFINPPGCASVHFNAEPLPAAGGPYAGQEGTSVQIASVVSDVDGPGLSTTWSINGVSNVDPGVVCSFGDASALSTTVTCTDDGLYQQVLLASDGVNPPVPAVTTLSLTNVAPSVSISAPANGTLVTRGTTVGFTAPFTDVGTNDTHTCTVDFNDGTPIAAGTVGESPGSGTCTIGHTFTAVGAHHVLVRITDDDGGAATAVVTVVVSAVAEAFALQASGLITIPKTPHATCPPGEVETIASLNLAVGVITALNASCVVDPATGTTTAATSVGTASLLGGLITITEIQASCVASASGISGSARVATINGIPIGTGSGSISIPLVATVFYNETATNASGQLVQNAIRVRTLLGQEIILAGCRIG